MYILRGSTIGQTPLPARPIVGTIDWCRMRQTIAATARAEEARWTRPNGTKRLENDPAMLPALVQYWAAVPGFENLQRARRVARLSAANHPR